MRFSWLYLFVKRLKKLCGIDRKLRHKSASVSEMDYSLSKNNTLKTREKFETEKNKFDKRTIKNCPKPDKNDANRELFTDDEIKFCAPSWLNFRFDATAIMECLS